jgi:hypothetical protein
LQKQTKSTFSPFLCFSRQNYTRAKFGFGWAFTWRLLRMHPHPSLASKIKATKAPGL